MEWKEMSTAVANKEQFTGTNFKSVNILGFYFVYSYEQMIGFYVPNRGWYINTGKYSATTSKHQKAAFYYIEQTRSLDKEEFDEFVDDKLIWMFAKSIDDRIEID